jgi:hypothetical protein
LPTRSRPDDGRFRGGRLRLVEGVFRPDPPPAPGRFSRRERELFEQCGTSRATLWRRSDAQGGALRTSPRGPRPIRGAGKRITAVSSANPKRSRTDGEGVERHTIGGEYVHIAGDDRSRPALRRGALRREGDYHDRVLATRGRVLERHGMAVGQLLIDNGSA